MPIRKDLRKFYTGAHWKEVRTRILERAGHKCEQCGKPDRELVWVYKSEASGQYWTRLKGVGQKWTYCKFGESGNFFLYPNQWAGVRQIRVKIGVAHLNHVAGDDRDENLKALCSWCHFNFDRLQHKATRSARKDRSRPILQMEAAV
jgi:5-methylcytosine-specific restriction endonuclease McrA